MEIAGGISATKAGFDLIKGIRELLKREKVDPQEISARLLELQELLLQAQSALGDAQEENRQLRQQLANSDAIKELEADLEMEPDGQFLVRNSEKKDGKYIPYCPICWGESNKLIPLTPLASAGYFDCVLHKARFRTKNATIAVPIAVTRPREPNSWR